MVEIHVHIIVKETNSGFIVECREQQPDPCPDIVFTDVARTYKQAVIVGKTMLANSLTDRLERVEEARRP